MVKRLQNFHHDSAHYDRPNLVWICGHSPDGRACPLGQNPRTVGVALGPYSMEDRASLAQVWMGNAAARLTNVGLFDLFAPVAGSLLLVPRPLPLACS